jgi:hypothetical protein
LQTIARRKSGKYIDPACSCDPRNRLLSHTDQLADRRLSEHDPVFWIYPGKPVEDLSFLLCSQPRRQRQQLQPDRNLA